MWIYPVGYHYIIFPDGWVEQGRVEGCLGAHATGHNPSIGICLVDNSSSPDNPDGRRGLPGPTGEQLRALGKESALRLITFILAGFILLQTGCDKQPGGSARQTKSRPPLQAPTEMVKVKVNQSGEIFIEGKPATIDELKREFARLKQVNGGVWYYAEDSFTPQSEAVKRAIIEAHLPMKLTSEKFE